MEHTDESEYIGDGLRSHNVATMIELSRQVLQPAYLAGLQPPHRIPLNHYSTPQLQLNSSLTGPDHSLTPVLIPLHHYATPQLQLKSSLPGPRHSLQSSTISSALDGEVCEECVRSV